MHEMGMALTLYESCREEVAKHGPGRLEKVRVQIGELTGIEPELLKFAWQAVLEGGADAGCELHIDWRPAEQFCPTCGSSKPRPDSSWIITCPDCESALQVQGGYELDLVEITFESNAEGDKA